MIAAAVLSSLILNGVYGVSLASTGLLSALAFTIATDAYGPVVDNAGGIAESKKFSFQLIFFSGAIGSKST